MTLVEMLENNAKEMPEKTAIIYRDIRITFKGLNITVNKLANALISSGFRKGDRIAFMLPRIPELVISFLAIAKSQGIAVPVSSELPVEKIRDILNTISPQFLIVDGRSLELAKKAVSELNTPVILTGNHDDECFSWNEFLRKGNSGNPGFVINADDVVYLNYTSGSTGNPKGALTTHANIYWNTVAAADSLELNSDDIHLCMFAPFAHPHEIFARSLYLGGTMVLVDKIYPKSLANAISEHEVTCMMGLAPMYENLLDLLEHRSYDLSSLRIPESGGMFTRAELIERFKQKLGVQIIPVWGSTETTGIAIANSPGESIIPCSVGKPCASYEVKIVDENDMEVPAGEIGEMIFKGPAVVKAYFESADYSHGCFKNGWYCSGDLGKKDDKGNLYFIERKTGMMKVAGLKVYPLEIEQALMEHPSIKEVAVISIKDRLRGEIPRAIIVTANGEKLTKEDVFDFCKKRLSHYKLPRSVEIRESLPKIGSGKVNKKVLQTEVA